MKMDTIEYSLFKESSLEKRYLPPSLLKSIITKRGYKNFVIGKSSENRDIYLLHHGQGSKPILLWSQMHGNESTPTRAMLDVFRFLNSTHPIAQKISEALYIDYIPQLNPDGAHHYTRRNAFNIDLNRDFLSESSVELPILKAQVEKQPYQFLFNLHDQRSIFHPKQQQHPATLSFLSPAVDESRRPNATREDAMKLIVSMQGAVKNDLPHGIARFTDEFYPLATGDNFQKANYPTILIECGHYPNDYLRSQTRKYTFKAIIAALLAITEDSWQNNSINTYQNIPENQQTALDIIYKHVEVKNDTHASVLDIGILYEEVLENDEIQFIAKITAIGDLRQHFGYLEIDAERKTFSSNDALIPQINQTANFSLSEWKIVNGQRHIV